MIQEEIDKDAKADVEASPVVGDKPLDVESMERHAAEAKKVEDLGSRAAGEVQKAFAGKNIAELGSIVDKFVAQAKDSGVDEKQARAALKEQLGLYHDTYKQAGLDAQAAEIDSFARSLENAGEVSSKQGKALAEMIDSGTFASMEDFNAALDRRMKAVDNKIPGTEVNVLIAKAGERFKAEEDAMKAAQAEESKKGLGATESDIDDMLGAFGEDKKVS